MFPRRGPFAAVSRALTLLLVMLLIMTVPGSSLLPVAYAVSQDVPALQYTLTEISSAGQSRDSAAPVAATTPLSEERVQAILSKLSPLAAPPEQKMILPGDSLVKPPIPGNQIIEVFPPKIDRSQSKPVAKPEIKSMAPLLVSRISHSGNVDNLTQLAITFSQPLKAMSQVAAVDPSKFVNLSPQPKGAWKWAGSQTLLFNPEGGRFPKATKYVVTVPSTATSVSGNKIASARNWTITTPVVKVTSFYAVSSRVQPKVGAKQQGAFDGRFYPRPPTDADAPQSTAPVFFAQFNQAVDANQILAKTRVRSGKQNYSIRLLSKEQLLGRSAEVKESIPSSDIKNWIAFESVTPFSKGSRVSIVFEQSLPSAEGPLLSHVADNHSVQIHGPFKLSGAAPTVEAGENGYIELEFTNPIDTNNDPNSLISVSPSIELLTKSINGNRLTLQGNIKAVTGYQIKVKKELSDDFGQKLAEDCIAQVQSGRLEKSINSDSTLKAYSASGLPMFTAWVQGAKGVRVQIRKVEPKDYVRFRQSAHNSDEDIIGKLLHNENYDIGTNGRQLDVDLKKYLPGKYGHLMVRADLLPIDKDSPVLTKSWVEVTDIGLDVFNSKELEVLATNISDASPLPGVELQLSGQPLKVVTDSTGKANVARPGNIDEQVLIARRGSDTALLGPQEHNNWPTNIPTHYTWSVNELSPGQKWYAVSDRNLYKPGELVNVKGWLRQLSYNNAGGINLDFPKTNKVTYKVFDSTGTEILSGLADSDGNGGFNYEINLPDKLPLGSAQIQMMAGQLTQDKKREGSWDPENTLSIVVQDFRKPEFEMKLTAVKKSALVVGDSVDLTASAQYLVGGSLASSNVDWSVSPSEAGFTPPGWTDFSFARGFDYYQWIQDNQHLPNFNQGQKTLKGVTDSAGKDSVQIKFNSMPPVAMNYLCQATVVDVNRQSWSDSMNLLVHPADLYVGIKKDKPDYHLGDAVNLEVLACDLDGKVKDGAKVDLTINELDTDDKESSKTHALVMASKPVKLQFQLGKNTKSFTCTATVVDGNGRKNSCVERSTISMPEKKTTKLATAQSIELVADKKEYKPGDVAEIAIKSPFKPARGLVIVTRNRNISSTPLAMNDIQSTIKIPITDNHYPIVRVEIFLAGSSTAFGSASLDLSVPPEARKLKLTARASQNMVAPGHEATIDVELKDAAGNPVADNQVALAVVDESVLALSNYKWQDPIDFFYPKDLPPLSESHSRAYSVIPDAVLPRDRPFKATYMLRQGGSQRYMKDGGGMVGGVLPQEAPRSDLSSLPPPSAVAPPPLPGGALQDSREMEEMDDSISAGKAAGASGPVPEMMLRKNFSALAIFKPMLTTDVSGKAQVVFRLPDNVTRYRIMAVAVGNTNLFGSSESVLTAQMPMMVKPSPPRFMQLSDRCELPVVIQNQTDHELQAEVAIRAENAQIQNGGKLVIVPANDRVEVRFETVATGQGQAQFQCAAVSGQLSDAAEFNFPVLVPASSESFAAYGVVDNGVALQKIETPHDVYEKRGGLSIETSSTAVQSLTDAYIFLRDYPYLCSEQLSSRLLAMLSLEDSLTAFSILKGDEKVKYHNIIQNDIQVLEKRQCANGGFGLWVPNEAKAWPYVSIQVTRALCLAKEKHYVVNESALNFALNHLKNIEKFIPSDYAESVRVAVIARALNVRHLQKDDDISGAKRLLDRVLIVKERNKSKPLNVKEVPIDQLKYYVSVEMASWLLVILDKNQTYSSDAKLLRSLIESQIKETASTASANEGGYGRDWDYCIFASPRRTDAAVLEALMEDQPKSELIPKLVKGLLAHRKNGVWDGTQENGYILQALDRYFRIYEKQTPDFVAQTWLGNTLVANHKFAGRTVDSKLTQIPMSFLLQQQASEILINKEGPGRLYYRLGLDYVPKNLNLQPLEQGFIVSRNYSAVDAKDDVQKDNNGVWHFKAGSSVKVKVHFEAPGARYHVAMADPIPAGAEPVNSALLGNRTDSVDQPWQNEDAPGEIAAPRMWWYGQWYEHDNLRDHQAEAFTSLLTAGVYDYTYTIRATTPGHFTVPPPKVEEMYMSETFGRGQTETVIIE